MTVSVTGSTLAGATQRFTVMIIMEGAGGDGLMRVASALHRRQIEIRQAAYRRSAAISRMEVVVEAAASRVRTAALTLQNITGVTACEVIGPETEQREADGAVIASTRADRYRPGPADQRRAG